MKKEQTNGNCYICGKNGTKSVIKNHVLKEHNKGNEDCYLIKAEGKYNKNYWLYLSIPLDTSLSAIDKFLRKIWCECCGHLSEFTINREKVAKTTKISEFILGEKILYEYDFGSTTEILLTVIDEISRPNQKEKIRLIARNEDYVDNCYICNKKAAYIDAYERNYVCEECADSLDEETYLIPITNSPRCGECGYDGELDDFNFVKAAETTKS